MPRPITHPDEVALALGMSSPTAGGWGADVEQTQLPTTTLSSRDTRALLSSDISMTRTEVSPRGSPQRDVHIEKARALALGEDLKHDNSRHADKKEEITLAPDPHQAPIKKAETPHAQRSGPPPSTDDGGHDTPAAAGAAPAAAVHHAPVAPAAAVHHAPVHAAPPHAPKAPPPTAASAVAASAVAAASTGGEKEAPPAAAPPSGGVTFNTLLWVVATVILIVALPAIIVGSVSLQKATDACNTNTAVGLGEDGSIGNAELGSTKGYGTHWEYYEEDNAPLSPEFWFRIHKDCMGKRQSPINIRTSEAFNDSSLALSEALISDLSSVVENDFKNLVYGTHNGHAVGASGIDGFFKYKHLTADFMDYQLLQFHLHTPSEHRVDDKLYPAELHLVHQNAAGAYLVIGVLLDLGVNDFEWGQFLEKFPMKSNDSPIKNIELPYKNLMQRFLGKGNTGNTMFWTYSGSFTTPPCTEDVTWILLQTPATISATSLTRLKTAILPCKASNQAVCANNRPVQPLNDRPVHQPVYLVRSGNTPTVTSKVTYPQALTPNQERAVRAAYAARAQANYGDVSIAKDPAPPPANATRRLLQETSASYTITVYVKDAAVAAAVKASLSDKEALKKQLIAEGLPASIANSADIVDPESSADIAYTTTTTPSPDIAYTTTTTPSPEVNASDTSTSSPDLAVDATSAPALDATAEPALFTTPEPADPSQPTP